MNYNVLGAKKQIEGILFTRQKQLEPIAIKAAHAYYSEDEPIMADAEYDAIYKELQLIESIREQIKKFEQTFAYLGLNADNHTKTIENFKP